ncbi:MAG TPA: intein-containing Rv2578c family radical SAM protein [Pseudonocardia sp.]|nr:intein-containing Rv2578c family radical SAM protein [Pseudonocardia sp.]
MRWSAQQVLDDGVGSELALPGLRGLLRTVRVPEFAGVTFHEVEAKSALNRVPGDSPVPFRWTVNPYRGCGHACVYCLDGATRVLLADGRTRPLSDVRPGDAVLGTEVDAVGVRRYVPTPVLAHWSTTKPAHRVTLADGTTLVASGEHRFLTARGWRHVAPGWCRAGRRRRLRRGDVLLGPGALPAARAQTASYRQGYLHGLVRADQAGRMRVRDGRIDQAFPSERLELEALGRAHHLLAVEVADHVRSHAPASPEPAPRAGSPVRRRLIRVGATGPDGTTARDAERAVRAVPPPGIVPGGVGLRRPPDPDDDWCAGLLGGMADAAGTTTAGVLRLSTVDEELVGLATGALHRLGFSFVVEKVEAATAAGARCTPRAERRSPSVRHLRLEGGSRELLRFLTVAAPAVSRLRGLADAAVGGDPGLEVVDISPAGAPVPMFDITTGTGDFVAEGVVSHNCFARNTHTYLDLDAGADFDRQIVVKVNVARVLERELRAPRWQREPVAMGTNTDPYQRAEGRYRLMPGIVDALAGSGTPFSVLTKGTVLTRDLPRLRAASADVPVGLGVSIALLDRELQARLEPGAPSPEARLQLVRRITDAGLPCGVMVAPVLPLLTDSAEALDALLARIAAAGATGATVLALHLRPGAREWFQAWLAREYPALVEPYARLYRRGSYVDAAYRRALAERVAPLLRRHRLTSEVAPLPVSRRSGPGAAGAVPGSIGLHRSLAAEARAAPAGSTGGDGARSGEEPEPCQLTLL